MSCFVLRVIGLLLLLSVGWAQAAGPMVRIRAPQSSFDASHNYFSSLIELALQKSDQDGRLQPLAQIKMAPYMVQQRALKELRAGRLIDIYWAGTNIEREETLRAIRIPLVKGLLGFRGFALHESKRPLLKQIKTVEQLQSYTLCQGAYWPDTDIMLAAGLNVMPGAVYENMFRQVTAGRCDFFPRGIHEGVAEVNARQASYPGLEFYDELILYYPFPMYLFVNRNNEALAERLERGLEAAIDDGSFDAHMRTHPVTKHLFPLDKWMTRARFIKLDNPFLPPDTDTTNSRYWIVPPATGAASVP